MDEKLKKLEQIKRLKEKVEYINKFMHPSKLFRPKSQLDFDKFQQGLAKASVVDAKRSINQHRRRRRRRLTIRYEFQR